MQCPNCGAQTNGKFCEYCGSKMPRIAPETVNNDNSRTTIVNNYYQSSTVPITQSQNRSSFNARTQPKIPVWKKTWFIVLICVLMPYIGVFFLWAAKKPLNKTARIVLSVVLVFYSIGIFSSSKSEDGQNEAENQKPVSVWLDGYTSIDDFEYYIDGNEIYLTDYDSSEKKVRINSSYEIDGNTYNVVSLDGVFTLNRVTSIIIPEGVRSVAVNEFNSCGVKFLYLPSTLQNIGSDSFWGYFHDVEKIYYGGSEEQWNQLCTVERSRIKAKQIIYDSNPEDLK